MSAAARIDALTDAQDALVLRLTAGRLSTRRLSAEHAAHVATLTRAGWSYDEAECAFWEGLALARLTREAEERSAAR